MDTNIIQFTTREIATSERGCRRSSNVLPGPHVRADEQVARYRSYDLACHTVPTSRYQVPARSPMREPQLSAG